MRTIVFTMAYNEAENIGRWVDYYTRQLGPDSTLIVDNASDDESVEIIRRNRNILYPKMVFSNNLRASFCSELANSLLLLYDVVIYTDADEFLVANPAKFENLAHFLRERPGSGYTPIGFDLVHMIGEEPECPADAPFLRYRKHLKPVKALCKPLITRRPVKWGGAFHTSDAVPVFDEDLWMFHTKSADFERRLRRQAITRKVVRDDNSGAHQRWDDETLRANFNGLRQEPRRPFTAEARQELAARLTRMVQRKYFEQVDIVKYGLDPDVGLERGVLRLEDGFPELL
jgi:glycosyltransferase involved in cell wall biosynthesis